MPENACPFYVGQTVFYRPSIRGLGWEAPSTTPPIGAAVQITEIQDGKYLVLEEWLHPGGGTHWTEFSDS